MFSKLKNWWRRRKTKAARKNNSSYFHSENFDVDVDLIGDTNNFPCRTSIHTDTHPAISIISQEVIRHHHHCIDISHIHDTHDTGGSSHDYSSSSDSGGFDCGGCDGGSSD